MMEEKPRYLQEFEALPDWAQKLVRGLAGSAGYGGGGDNGVMAGMSKESRDRHQVFHIILHNERAREWWDGYGSLQAMAAAMTAPWPKPVPVPHAKMHASNPVEMLAGEDCAFDQPCHYGHRVESHAVYCHNDTWPSAPRKCRRGQDGSHAECPGYWPNSA